MFDRSNEDDQPTHYISGANRVAELEEFLLFAEREGRMVEAIVLVGATFHIFVKPANC